MNFVYIWHELPTVREIKEIVPIKPVTPSRSNQFVQNNQNYVYFEGGDDDQIVVQGFENNNEDEDIELRDFD